MPIDWQPLQEIISSHQRFVITSHVRPDADAIGSEMGLKALLEQLGKEVRIINPSATPDHLQFLDPDKSIQKIGPAVSLESACDTDVHIVVDTSAWIQLGDVGKVLEKTNAKKVVIDHHLSSDDLGATEFKDTTAAATGTLITEFAEFLDLPPAGDQATALFAAMATDTGWFRFPNSTERTYSTAARLISYGVQPNALYRELYERSSLARLKLHAVILDRVTVEFAGRLAYTFAMRKDFSDTRSQPADTEDIVNTCLTIEGVEAAFILVQQMDGRIKASLRSREGFSVAAVAEQFGGGGHRLASGAMLPGPMEQALESLLEVFKTTFPPSEDLPQ
ncbi:MAG: bifunctional oligoribonuclease/PAP phosphatase NrnA [Planctomicrobium sp.]|jgi:bifunctional oligoribonuclease and PAP phosphatase NrnA|nr:bifunctional oligoribonuclease/PAP phosphatase NrnA [Planctomicrobium sp.]